jgi:hypothetical protein
MPSRRVRRNVLQVALALGAGRAPGVLGGHPPDERSDLPRQGRTAGAPSSSGQPVPVDAEPSAVPAHEGARPDDGEGLGPVAPRPAQQDPEDPVRGPESGCVRPARGANCWRRARFSIARWRRERMAEKSVGRRATRRRSIEPGRILALGEIVNGSSADGVLASDRPQTSSPRCPLARSNTTLTNCPRHLSPVLRFLPTPIPGSGRDHACIEAP